MRYTDRLAIILAPHHETLRVVFYASIISECLCFAGYLIANRDVMGAATVLTPWLRDFVRWVQEDFDALQRKVRS